MPIHRATLRAVATTLTTTLLPPAAARGQKNASSLNTGHRRDYGSGFVYLAYFACDDLMFPILVGEQMQKQNDYLFGIRQFGGAKAWPLSAFERRPAINDGTWDRPLLLIGVTREPGRCAAMTGAR
ncbi:MAG: hypothetical protein AAGC86_02050 [Pseudomonadota bacterium]